MTRRQANVCLCLFVFAFISTVVVAFFLTMAVRKERQPKFIDPVIWREPHTGGEPRIDFDVRVPINPT